MLAFRLFPAVRNPREGVNYKVLGLSSSAFSISMARMGSAMACVS